MRRLVHSSFLGAFAAGSLACAAPLRAQAGHGAVGQADTTVAPPVAVYVLALDGALVHLGPRAQPFAVYLPPGVRLPEGTLEQRHLRARDDRSPCAGTGVIELLPARRDAYGKWVLESITRPVNVMTFGDLSRIECVGEICASRDRMPIDREETSGCPAGGVEFPASPRRDPRR